MDRARRQEQLKISEQTIEHLYDVKDPPLGWQDAKRAKHVGGLRVGVYRQNAMNPEFVFVSSASDV